MPLTLRSYQVEALEALSKHFAERCDNPCVVLPTGSGKSFVIAELIRRMMASNPDFHCIVLAHRQELVDQNSKEYISLVGSDVGVGINCVGLGRRDKDAPIIFAMISAVHRNAADFPSVDMVVVDEAHHIPITDNGMYRKFIGEVKAKNPGVRIVGFTATPYRLDVGHVCHRDYILNEVCYEANVGYPIGQGYLCKLRSKVSKLAPNLEGISEVGGDYKNDELSARVCVSELVRRTVDDAISRINAEQRKCCVWFCVDVKHCEMVRNALSARGELVGMVTGETSKDEREKITASFRSGEIRHLVNVMVFTEGFNVKQVDAIVLLRPTLSRGLYVQMVGRGLRVHPDKIDCIVLDYARCIEEHGPIDQTTNDFVPMEICPQCEELFARALRVCPKCGYVVSEEEVRRHNACDERKIHVRRLHEEMASCREILALEYGGVGYRKIVNPSWLIEYLLFLKAFSLAYRDGEYQVKWNRTKPTGDTFRVFLKEFIEYARDVELTYLPDMLKDYFESDVPHPSELRRKRRIERELNLNKWFGKEMFEISKEDVMWLANFSN